MKLQAVNGSLTVSSEGIALADAAMGQQVRVKNTRSNRIVDARVTGPGEAKIYL